MRQGNDGKPWELSERREYVQDGACPHRAEQRSFPWTYKGEKEKSVSGWPLVLAWEQMLSNASMEVEHSLGLCLRRRLRCERSPSTRCNGRGSVGIRYAEEAC